MDAVEFGQEQAARDRWVAALLGGAVFSFVLAFVVGKAPLSLLLAAFGIVKLLGAALMRWTKTRATRAFAAEAKERRARRRAKA